MIPPELPPGVRLAVFDTLDSTNEEARRRAASGDRGPLWIQARRQTAGRGRRGRSWESPEGNLMATLLLAPGVGAPEGARLSFVAALAVYDVIHQLLPAARVAVKWPNDVLVAGSKISGILLEAASETGGVLPWLAVGIGINLVHGPVETVYPATFVAAHGRAPGSDEVMAMLAQAWEQRFVTWQSAGFAPVRDAWLGVAKGVGAPVDVRLPTGTLQGIFEGLSSDGELELRLADGSRRLVSSGEIFFPAQ